MTFRKTEKTQWKSTQFSNFRDKSTVFRCFWSSGGLRTHSNHAEVQKLSNRWFANRNSNDISVDRGYLGMPLMHQVLRHVMPRGCHGNAAIGRVFCWDNGGGLSAQISAKKPPPLSVFWGMRSKTPPPIDPPPMWFCVSFAVFFVDAFGFFCEAFRFVFFELFPDEYLTPWFLRFW